MQDSSKRKRKWVAPLVCAAVVLAFLIALLVIWLWRRSVRKGKDPDFEGPVINVDYKVVDDEESPQDKTDGT